MANQVFESALATITQAMGAVEGEVKRLESFDTMAKGIQIHINALRTQESELKATVNDLAAQIPGMRKTIADAEASASKIVQDGERQKASILEAARTNAAIIVDEAHREADRIKEDAKSEAAPYRDRVDAAKRELASIGAQINALTAQAEITKEALARMKQSAAAFASS